MDYKVKTASKLEWDVKDDIMFIEGTLGSPGTFTGIDGNTIEWPEKVISKAAPSAKKRPILYAHTDDEGDEKFLTVGYVADSKDVGSGKTRYKGVIYNDTIFPLIEKGEFNAVSPEIDFDGEKLGERKYRATEAAYTSMVLTNTPANKDATIDKYGFMHVSLERRKTKMDLGEKKVGELSDEEKLNFVREYLKSQNLPMPTQEDLEDDPEDKPDDKPEDKPEDTKIDLEPLTNEVNTLKDQNVELAKQVNYLQSKELAGLGDSIAEIDSEFKMEAFLEGVDGFDTKKARLESHLSTLERLLPRIQLELGSDPAKLEEEKEEKKKAALEMLGPEKAKEMYPEFFEGGSK